MPTCRFPCPGVSMSLAAFSPRLFFSCGMPWASLVFEACASAVSEARKSLRAPVTRQASLGLLRELNPGPLAPEARIMPLDQAASWCVLQKLCHPLEKMAEKAGCQVADSHGPACP